MSRPAALDDVSSAEASQAVASRIWAAAAIALSSALTWYFHNVSWYPADEGNYAHVAQRVASGEVLNLGVQDIHAGYVNFLNAAALRLLGTDLLSLRYPLALAAMAQAALLYKLLSRRNRAAALVAAVASVALGVIQFFNPTAHWYCSALTVALVFWLIYGPRVGSWRLVGAGVFVGLIALFRQPSGVWVGMGVLTIAIAERADGAPAARIWFTRAILSAMLLAVIGYALATRELLGAFLIASSPAAILVWMLMHVKTRNRDTTTAILQLARGAAIAAAPLVAYHVLHHSVSSWLNDILFTAAKLTTLDFFGQRWYAFAVFTGVKQAIFSFTPSGILNGVYWTALPLLPLVNGLGILRLLRRNETMGALTLPIIAAFYALVSLHFQIPIYLYYSAGITLAAVLWQKAAGPTSAKVAWVSAAATLAAVGVFYHAGQPYTRTSRQIIEGWRRSSALVSGFERCSLRLDREDREVYRHLVSLIDREVPPGGSIFAVPSDAELYFLADRRNPFRFYNTALGVQTGADLRETLDLLAGAPPTVVTFRPKDKYNTSASMRIVEGVRANYDLIATVGEVEVYRFRRSDK